MDRESRTLKSIEKELKQLNGQLRTYLTNTDKQSQDKSDIKINLTILGTSLMLGSFAIFQLGIAASSAHPIADIFVYLFWAFWITGSLIVIITLTQTFRRGLSRTLFSRWNRRTRHGKTQRRG